MGSEGKGRDGRGGERKEREGHREGKGRKWKGEPYRYFQARGSVSFNLMFSVVYANNFSA